LNSRSTCPFCRSDWEFGAEKAVDSGSWCKYSYGSLIQWHACGSWELDWLKGLYRYWSLFYTVD
jgi:hypothetical protein